MSVGHWIVIAADICLAGINLTGLIFHPEDRHDRGILTVSVAIIILMLFNIAAITVR